MRSNPIRTPLMQSMTCGPSGIEFHCITWTIENTYMYLTQQLAAGRHTMPSNPLICWPSQQETADLPGAKKICRVLFIGHPAKKFFAGCQAWRHPANKGLRQSSLCLVPGTRQIPAVGKNWSLPGAGHSAKYGRRQRWPAWRWPAAVSLCRVPRR